MKEEDKKKRLTAFPNPCWAKRLVDDVCLGSRFDSPLFDFGVCVLRVMLPKVDRNNPEVRSLGGKESWREGVLEGRSLGGKESQREGDLEGRRRGRKREGGK